MFRIMSKTCWNTGLAVWYSTVLIIILNYRDVTVVIDINNVIYQIEHKGCFVGIGHRIHRERKSKYGVCVSPPPSLPIVLYFLRSPVGHEDISV